MLLQNLYVPFSTDGAFTDVQVHHSTGTYTPPYHHRCWLLNFALITVWMVLFLFDPEDTTSMISKNNLKCGLVRSQHTFPLCFSPSQMMLLLYPIMALICFQLTDSPVECSKQVFFKHSSNFPVFCCPRPSYLETCCRHPIQNESISAQKQ